MGDIDPVRVYMDARANYDRARKASGALLSLVARVTQAANHDPASLLVRQFKLSPPPSDQPDRRFSPTVMPIDIQQWPDLSALTAAFTETHAAHLRMHEAWNALTDQDRLTLAHSGPRNISLQ